MKAVKFYISIFLTLFFVLSIYSQEEQKLEEEKGSFHRIGLNLSHTNVFSGVKDQENKLLSLPSWGIDYDFWFSEKWAIGLHTDILIEKYTVEENLDSQNKILERNKPIAPAVMGTYHFGRHNILFGAGAEFAEEENLFLNRVGYEYGIEFLEKWELGFSINYDFRWNAYDSFSIGIEISRIFRNKSSEK
ncbi:hypothetical protein [Mesonia aquimarina]|uniref:hypothetical protein n=1 Tax=Mesonia aquimarina TaxID=1504967 RepID=UPI000EF63147|nr:hypothetical protein [Mesonia aquimarina]